MYNYQRTLSTSQGSGSAVLETTVDGRIADSAARTAASAEFSQTFGLRGLTYGRHTVQIKVRSGILVVDAVAVAG